MDTRIIRGYLQDAALRWSFNALAGEVFGLDFEPWYQNGWSGGYCPYAAVREGRVLANVSANRIDCLLDGQPRRYVQLGTVMTGAAHRGRGLCRQLMERVLADCAGCDGVFLYANGSVLDFYPKFGFQPVKEYRFQGAFKGAARASVRPVPMASPADWQAFLVEKNRRTGQGLLQLDTDGILMFHLSQYMRDAVYFVPDADAYIVAEREGGTLTVYGMFAPSPVAPLDLCRAFGPEVERVCFAFTPADQTGLELYEHQEEDTTLFVQGEPLFGDMEAIKGFPALVHA